MKDQEVVDMTIGFMMKQILKLGEDDCKILTAIQMQTNVVFGLLQRIEKLEQESGKMIFREKGYENESG